MTDQVDWSGDDKIAHAQEHLWIEPQWRDLGTRPQYGTLHNNQIVALHGAKALTASGSR